MVELSGEAEEESKAILEFDTNPNTVLSEISSDAWPPSQQPTVKSRAHAILLSIIGSGKFSQKNIEYKALDDEDQAEMKTLHAEWFPITYPQSFFDRMAKNNVIAFGCFYRVELPALEGQDPFSDSIDLRYAPITELIMIGCIFSRVESENIRNQSLLTQIDAPRWDR